VNVWAYHSARRMIYVNPKIGHVQEHHKLKSRRGQMWVKWFDFTLLNSVYEDLALSKGCCALYLHLNVCIGRPVVHF
jgi:hypothetical protein